MMGSDWLENQCFGICVALVWNLFTVCGAIWEDIHCVGQFANACHFEELTREGRSCVALFSHGN